MIDLTCLSPIDVKASLIALACAFVIGFERQWSGKPAGIRTSILICLSAFTFVSIGQFLQPEAGSVRIVGQIVTGVGFLGGGVILSKEGLVKGVTSAAVIWVLAATGSLIGLGYFSAAIWLTFLTLFTLVGITFLDKLLIKLKIGVHEE